MRAPRTIRNIRLLFALGLALWCAGVGCILHGAAMTANEVSSAPAEKGFAAMMASAGGHDCCKARHPALKRTAGSNNANTHDDAEQISLPQSPLPARSCCPLTSGSFVATGREASDLKTVTSIESSPLPLLTGKTSQPRVNHVFHFPNESKAYLLDCVFLI